MSSPGRVLLVDDDPPVRRALERLLKRNGFVVAGFDCPLAALAQIAEFKPDTVVSDFKMPGMDGVAFLREVRARYPGARRCLLTGYADLSSVQPRDGEDIHFLSKPWDDNQLVSNVTRSHASP